jgi:hypothetical protein
LRTPECRYAPAAIGAAQILNAGIILRHLLYDLISPDLSTMGTCHVRVTTSGDGYCFKRRAPAALCNWQAKGSKNAEAGEETSASPAKTL